MAYSPEIRVVLMTSFFALVTLLPLFHSCRKINIKWKRKHFQYKISICGVHTGKFTVSSIHNPLLIPGSVSTKHFRNNLCQGKTQAVSFYSMSKHRDALIQRFYLWYWYQNKILNIFEHWLKLTVYFRCSSLNSYYKIGRYEVSITGVSISLVSITGISISGVALAESTLLV